MAYPAWAMYFIDNKTDHKVTLTMLESMSDENSKQPSSLECTSHAFLASLGAMDLVVCICYEIIPVIVVYFDHRGRIRVISTLFEPLCFRMPALYPFSH